MAEADDKKPRDPVVKKSLTNEHKKGITKAIFAPSLKQVISSSLDKKDNNICAWGLRPNARPNKFKGHLDSVYDVAVNDKGDTIASCSRDQTVMIWENNA